MRLGRRVISADDNERLLAMVDDLCLARGPWGASLQRFGAELRRAPVVTRRGVPADMITMHSRFELSDCAGRRRPYVLVYPDDANRENVSVITPMGRALLGARVGEVVAWLSPLGREVAVVRRLLYQPEASDTATDQTPATQEKG